MKIPSKLYKYKKFNESSLSLLFKNDIYVADPATFNDPLDCKPDILRDATSEKLQEIIIATLGQDIGKERIDKCKYMSSQYGDYKRDEKAKSYFIHDLYSEVFEIVKNRFIGHGIFSMSSNWDSPLMWSHYADCHKGICIEYDTEEKDFQYIYKVNYNSSRLISCNDVYEWLVNNDTEAEKVVFNSFFLNKASEWEYEDEYRFISKHKGDNYSPFKISAIYFGLKTEFSVIASIIKLMNSRNITFYHIESKDSGFELDRKQITEDDYHWYEPRESPIVEFNNVDIN